MRNFAAERIAIDCEPVRHRSNLGQIEVAQYELTRFRFVIDRNFVACFHIIRSDVDATAVHQHMAVRHQLARCAACISEAKAVNSIIESRLQ